MSGVDVRILDDPAAAAAELLAEAARAGAKIALSGGSTVGPAHERAAELEPDWGAAELFWGDERAVPPGDERSNYLLARTTLLDRLAVTPRAVHRIEGDAGVERAAALYDELLAGVTLDLAVNGIGPDGHTASLFPHAPALVDPGAARALAVEAQLEPLVPRITLTPPVFAETAVLVYLVRGSAKANAVRRALSEPPDPAIPSSIVRGRATIALLDREAAAEL